MQKRLLFRQLFDQESSTYTYILADPETGEGVLIDPVLETVNRDMQHVQDMGVSLKYVIDTHIHADHVTGSGKIRSQTGCSVVAGDLTCLDCADVLLSDGEELKFGHRSLLAISTPGHTEGCTSFYIPGMVFCGDTLLIRSCGRTDFQGGSSSQLYESIKNKLYKLPPDTQVLPAHDYLGQTSSTLHEEMQYNKRIPLTQKKEEFVNIMDNLDLPYPNKMDSSVPANQHCGELGYVDIAPSDLYTDLDKYTLVDVRSSAEYQSGHIQGAILATLGSDLAVYLSEQKDKTKPYVFICGVGRRSSQAREVAQEKGFVNTLNLKGGMSEWIKQGLPTITEGNKPTQPS